MKIIRTEARGPAKNGEDCGPDRRSRSDRGNTVVPALNLKVTTGKGPSYIVARAGHDVIV